MSEEEYNQLQYDIEEVKYIYTLVVVFVALVKNQKSRLFLVNLEVLHWRV